MKLNVYCVYDSKGECFVGPHFMQTDRDAVDAITDAVNDSRTSLNKHPGDYTLFCVGSFDQLTGKLSSFDAPRSIGSLIQFKKSSEVTV